MPRALRLLLITAGAAVALFVLLLGLAWAFMPRAWIQQEASRQAARMSGMTVRFRTLEPSMRGLSLGVRLEGLTLRSPAQGEATMEASVREVFIRLKLVPLVFRRVEVAAASIRGATLALTDRGTRAPGAPARDGAPGMALVLPEIRFEEVTVRSRDPFGGGFDLRNVSGSTAIEGALPNLRSLRLKASAESLYWKPSAKEPLVALPGPLEANVQLERRGREPRLAVSHGTLNLGPLKSTVTGGVTLPARGGAAAVLDLRLRGREERLRSDDAAWKPLAARLPAVLQGSAAWEVRLVGAADALSTSASLTVKPLAVAAGKNRFDLTEVRASFSSSPDRTYRASAEGNGSGVALSLRAEGSTLPGGSTRGSLVLKAPAERLNGLVPDAPTWESGTLECRALFTVTPPAQPQVRWTVTGRDLRGTSPGLPRPVTGLRFDVDGDATVAHVRALAATVGSTTARVSGTVQRGAPVGTGATPKSATPLGTGSFEIAIDRLVAEEWAPPRSGGAARAGAPGGSAGAPHPPIPLRSLDANVTIGELRSGGMRVRDVVAPVRFRDGALSIAPLRGAVGTGTLEGALSVARLLSRPSYSLRMDVKRAPVQEIATGLLPFGSAVSGLLSGTVELAGPGLPGAEVQDSLRGALNGTVEQGKILESPTLAGLRRSLGLTRGGDVAFRTLTHALRIARGRLVLDRVRGDLGQENFDLTGSVGLDRTLDLRLLLRLAPSRVEGGGTLAELARYARDEEGRVPVEISIGGSAAAPAFRVKAGRTLDAATRGITRKLTSELTRSLARADSGSKSADSSRADPLKKGREALEKLFRR